MSTARKKSRARTRTFEQEGTLFRFAGKAKLRKGSYVWRIRHGQFVLVYGPRNVMELWEAEPVAK